MKHRLFQDIATGAWAAAALSDDHFPDDDYVDRIAASLGLGAGTMRAVDIEDGEPDPRTGVLLEPIEVPLRAAIAEAVDVTPHTVLRGAEPAAVDAPVPAPAPAPQPVPVPPAPQPVPVRPAPPVA